MDLFNLDGCVALVTGGAGGIGAAAALALAEAGANVAIVGHVQDPEETRLSIEKMGRRSLAFRGDLAETGFQDKVVEGTLKEWGHIDILVNNAGAITRAPVADYSEEDWDRVIGLNLTAVFRMCQRVGRLMIKQKRGKIINVASLLSFSGGIRVPAYAASKGAVAQVTKAISNEWASLNINVNAIAPGYILTKLSRSLYEDPLRSARITERIPAGRWGNAEDLKGAIIFLASRASDYVHGHILIVDGGWMAR
ncbi:MAG: SDR family oxidoreductase [Acidobacteria bacterium]|nr:MAG: SDR family oxidoreductase [Acidobacteriota bacterium]